MPVDNELAIGSIISKTTPCFKGDYYGHSGCARSRDSAQEIQEKYTEVANSPELTFHSHHGRPLAKILEYPEELLTSLPDEAVESFAGVGNPFSVGEIAPGKTVLDFSDRVAVSIA